MEFRNFYDDLLVTPPLVDRYRLVHAIEVLITQLLHAIAEYGSAEILIPCHDRRPARVSYGREGSRLHFARLIYVLAEAHQLLIAGGSCTGRELYYKEKQLAGQQANVNRAVREVCAVLQTSPWNLGILASGKGLVAGNLRMHLHSGGLVDCRMSQGAVLLPQDFACVRRLESSAPFALIVEKDTVFSKLVAAKMFQRLGVDGILITGKGYPDLSTRALVHRLAAECHLPMYILVDADPYGVDIMLVYRQGAASRMPHSNAELRCPRLQWLGVHPTEIALMGIPSQPFNAADRGKVQRLLRRSDLEPGVRNELQVLGTMQRKAEIEGMSANDLDFFISDYLPNKIRRNLSI